MSVPWAVGAGLAGMLTVTAAHAVGKSFDGLSCTSNLVADLAGRQMPTERVAATEARHKDLGLKHLGAFGLEKNGDPWTLVSWQLCGREYALLERKGVVRDVLASPLPPGSPPSQIVSCKTDGAAVPGTVVAFSPEASPRWPAAVQQAWRIDDKSLRFVRVTGRDVICQP